jgi:hypothetical protein
MQIYVSEQPRKSHPVVSLLASVLTPGASMTALPNPALERDQIVKLCPNKSAIDRVELWHDFSHERAGGRVFYNEAQ